MSESTGPMTDHPEVVAEVNEGMEEARAGFNSAERVKILSDEWFPDPEELTPTSKLKRHGIHSKYAEEIEALYP